MPFVAADLVHLPLGLVETLLSPLPGLTVVNGLENTGIGLVAPFKVLTALLKLPFNILGNLSQLVREVNPGAAGEQYFR